MQSALEISLENSPFILVIVFLAEEVVHLPSWFQTVLLETVC